MFFSTTDISLNYNISFPNISNFANCITYSAILQENPEFHKFQEIGAQAEERWAMLNVKDNCLPLVFEDCFSLLFSAKLGFIFPLISL